MRSAMLAPLSNLSGTVGGIEIGDNSALFEIDGLAGITAVTGSIYLSDNPSLSRLNGLGNARRCGRRSLGRSLTAG